jgi:endonuclease/exonuclease/phosphatase family metal-dependent hydrolase
MRVLGCGLVLAIATGLFGSVEDSVDSVRVATYNLRNYLTMDRRVDGYYRPDYPKPESEKTALRKVIVEAAADILAVQEIGPLPYLEELRQDLRAEGLDYPYIYLLEAADEERHLGVLSRVAPVENHSVDLLFFKYFGEQEAVKRGLIELVFEHAGQPWSLFVVHLKSRFTDRSDDPESETRRLGEARAVRNTIVSRHPVPGEARYLVVGDLNDTRASRTVTALLKRGQTEISIDIPAFNPWGQTWTHFYEKEEVYSRADYMFASPGLLPSVRTARAVVVENASSSKASDHRLVYVDLEFPVPGPVGDAEDDNETPMAPDVSAIHSNGPQ